MSEPRSGAKGTLAPYLPYVLFVLAPLIVFPRAMLRNAMMDGGDDKLANLPLLLHSARKLLQGELFWTSDLWMGMPLLAEPESATLYVPRLMLLALPPTVAWPLYLCLHIVLAQIGAYLYLRALDLPRMPATLGAFVYGFAGFMVGHLGHTMYVVAGAWAPFFVYFLHRATVSNENAHRSALYAALAFAGCLFGGAVQLSVYVLSLAGMLHLALAYFTRSWRPLIVYVLFAVPAVLVTAPQWATSWEFAQTLTQSTREDYAFSTQLSFHPLLFPTLFLPNTQSIGELHARIGIVVFATVVFAMLVHRKNPLVRAWTVVFVAAFVLMLGRWVPPVARVLHLLPITGVLRGPVRHTFELGFAAAVLAAFGADAMSRFAPRLDRRALVVVGVTLAASVFVVVMCRSQRIVFDGSVLYSRMPTPVYVRMWLEVGLAIIALFAVRRMARSRLAQWVPAAILLVALFEATAAEDARGTTFWAGVARAGVPHEPPATKASFVRVLTPDLRSGYPTLPGNAPLYFPGVGSLTGYSSIAPEDAASVFDLDMHGHPRHRDDLAWSRLPAIFGVTHVMMPPAACPTPSFGLDGAAPIDALCTPGPSTSFPITGERRCVVDLGEGRRRYRVELDARAPLPLTKPVTVGLWARILEKGEASLPVMPAKITPEFSHFGANLDLGTFTKRTMWFGLYSDNSTSVELKNLELHAYELQAIAPLVGKGDLTIHGDVRRIDDRVTMPAGTGVERRVSLALDDPQALVRLEVIARKTRGSPRLAVDLYDGPSFDPPEAQVLANETLTEKHQVFVAEFHLPTTPPAAPLLRAFVEGDGEVEVESVRILAEKKIVVARMSSKEGVIGKYFDFHKSGADEVLRIGERGGVAFEVQLGSRPVVVEAELGGNNDGLVGLGVTAEDEPFSDDTESTFPPGAIAGTRRIRRAVGIPADAKTARMRVFHEGTHPIDVRWLLARDGCALAHYEPVRPIDGGVWLHRVVDAMPRAFTVGDVQTVSSIQEAGDRLRSSVSLDPHHTALVQAPSQIPDGLTEGRITSARFGSETIELAVEADAGPTFLVVNERFDDGFEAKIDGAHATILRTNALVRGLFVPQGRHHVQLAFRTPRAFEVGVLLALAGLLFAWFGVPRVLGKIGRA